MTTDRIADAIHFWMGMQLTLLFIAWLCRCKSRRPLAEPAAYWSQR